MTTLDRVTKKKPAEQSAEQQAAVELVRLAQEQGLSLTGPDGLLKKLTSPSRQQRAWSVVAVDGLLAGHAFENSRGFNQDVHRPGA